jgi:hypothetical protein
MGIMSDLLQVNGLSHRPKDLRRDVEFDELPCVSLFFRAWVHRGTCLPLGSQVRVVIGPLNEQRKYEECLLRKFKSRHFNEVNVMQVRSFQ